MPKSYNHLAAADNLFFGKGPYRRKTEKMVDDALAGCNDGELFLEYEQSESLAFDDGKLKRASHTTPPRASACAASPAKPRASPTPRRSTSRR